MSIIYHINDPKDSHWHAFSLTCREDLPWKEYNKKLDIALSKFNATLIREVDPTMWLSGIEFETEEDLVVFKLTFN